MSENRIFEEEACDVLIVGLIRGHERYVVVTETRKKSISNALRTLGRWAADPSLDFTHRDLCQMGRRLVLGAKE